MKRTPWQKFVSQVVPILSTSVRRDVSFGHANQFIWSGDNYHPEHSHVLPALIRRFHEAKFTKQPTVTIWGTGTPLREFLHVDDLADALVHLLKLPNPPDWVNVGSGVDLSIFELAKMVAEVVGYRGEIVTDPSKPDGTQGS